MISAGVLVSVCKQSFEMRHESGRVIKVAVRERGRDMKECDGDL